jgi:hypothetical protein
LLHYIVRYGYVIDVFPAAAVDRLQLLRQNQVRRDWSLGVCDWRTGAAQSRGGGQNRPLDAHKADPGI